MPLTRFPAFKVVRMFRLLIHRAEHVGKVHQAEASAGGTAQAFLIGDGIAGDADDCLVQRNDSHANLQARSASAAASSSKISAQQMPRMAEPSSWTGTT